MGHEFQQAGEQEHEGDKYLRLLGLDHLAGMQIPGRDLQVRDFLEVCGEHARPMLVGFESLSDEDPRYSLMRNALRTQVTRFLDIPLED